MAKRLLIRDLTLRDGQQSQLATRMTQAQVDRVLPYFKDAGFYAMEVWGGAVPDSVMRYLDEDPWKRLELIKEGVGSASKLTALSRGRNLFGYTPYPDAVIEGFSRLSVAKGLDIMRIFDALNDLDNLTSSIKYIKEAGGMADCAVCYTVDPQFSRGQRFMAALKGKPLPKKLFTIDYFVAKAKELEARGADMISIKDMSGLLHPEEAAILVKALKDAVGIPIDLHTHCTPGYGTASILMAMLNGVDIVDTTALAWSGGPAHVAYEIVQLFADRLGLDTGVNPGAVAAMDQELRAIRQELSKFDQFPANTTPVLDLSKKGEASGLTKGDGELFDRAVEAGRKGKADLVLELCQAIEARFNYPAPDHVVRVAQIPGGMYTNMLAQLAEAGLSEKLPQVMAAVPKVRLDCGVPPLVTPTSQIVGVQAVNCVVDAAGGKPFYTNVSKNFLELVKGSYGRTPWPVDPSFREKIAGVREETPYDTASYKPQANPRLPEFGGESLAKDEGEQLLLELFPSVATRFLKGRRQREWTLAHPPVPPKPERYPPRFWEVELINSL